MYEIVFLWFVITTRARAWLGCDQTSLRFGELTDQSMILTLGEPKLLSVPLEFEVWDADD